MRYIFIALLLSISSLTQAFTSNQQDFLPVEEAFRFEAMEDIEPNLLVWQITDKHYLYKHRTKVTDANGQVVEVDLPEGIDHSDEFFGDTQIYRHLLQVPIDADVARPIKVTWQGCADGSIGKERCDYSIPEGQGIGGFRILEQTGTGDQDFSL